jgi:hypothetical protein
MIEEMNGSERILQSVLWCPAVPKKNLLRTSGEQRKLVQAG